MGYVETKSLDGETNLKNKKLHPDIMQRINENNVYSTPFVAEFEGPNPYLYTFNGTIQFPDGTKAALDHSNIILRGSSLKNTKFIHGLVIYTGHHTKIMLNSVKARAKQSSVEKEMNKQILIVFLVQVGPVLLL